MDLKRPLRVESVGVDGYVSINGIVHPIRPGQLDRRGEIDTIDLAILRTALQHFARTGLGGEAIRERARRMVKVVQAELDALSAPSLPMDETLRPAGDGKR